MMYLVTLYVKSGAVVVDKIVINLKNANLRKEAFLDKRKLEEKLFPLTGWLTQNII